MSERHPCEIDLARFSDGNGDTDAGVAGHLHWCACCRSTVADYRWLQEGIEATLVAAAEAVPVPQPKWRAVRRALSVGQRRRAVGWRVSAVGSVVLAFCLMLLVSPVPGTVIVARALRPDPVAVLAAGTISNSADCAVSVATPTPAVSGGAVTPPVTPAFMLPPTPPEPET